MQDQTAEAVFAAAAYKDADFAKWGYVLVHGPKIVEAGSHPGRMWVPFADWKEMDKFPQWHLYRYPRAFYHAMALEIISELSLMYPERTGSK